MLCATLPLPGFAPPRLPSLQVLPPPNPGYVQIGNSPPEFGVMDPDRAGWTRPEGRADTFLLDDHVEPTV